MLEFLQRIFLGHVHQWEERSKHNLVDETGEVVGITVVLRCKHCGTLKNHTIGQS